MAGPSLAPELKRSVMPREKIVGQAFPPADPEMSKRRACPCTAVIPSREDGEGPRIGRLGHTARLLSVIHDRMREVPRFARDDTVFLSQ